MRPLPFLLVLAICAVSAAAVLYCGGHDKQTGFRAERLAAEPGMMLFFVGPYLLLAAAAVAGRDHRPSALAALAVTAGLAAVAVAAVWSDHATAVRTPPGREVAPMLGFLATLLLWLGGVVLLLAVGIGRVVCRGQPGAAELGVAPDQRPPS